MTFLDHGRLAAHVRTVSQRLGACVAIDDLRQAYETYPLDSTPSPHTSIREVDVPAGHWIGRPEFRTVRRGVYLHGGGFLAGGIRVYAGLVSRIADATHSWIFLSNYPLAPEQVYPAAHLAAVDACLYAKRHGPFETANCEHLFVAGDSCGAGLAMATAMHLRDNESSRVLNAVIGLSATLDLTASSEAYARCATSDFFVSATLTRQCAEGYAPGINPKEPRLSPLFGSFARLPPVLLQVSEHEAVCDDSARAAHEIRKSGGKVELQQWPNMPHVWHLFAGSLPEADDAVAKMATFVERACQA